MILVGTFDIIGAAYNILSIKENPYIINLSSANLQIKPSSLFYVPRVDMESTIYDIEYANYIFNNTQQRIELLYALNNVLMGNPLLIMIGTYPGELEMAESLLKLIQSRYGYNGYILNSIDDLENLDMYRSNFSVPGLLLLDKEKEELNEIYLKEEEKMKYGYK